MSFRRPFLLIVSAFLVVVSQAQPVFVAPEGRDSNPGTKERPLASLGAALRKAQKLHSPGASAEVLIRGGVYPISDTVVLYDDVAGTPGFPLRVSAYQGEEVRFSGGVSLPPAWRETLKADSRAGALIPAAARPHVIAVNLYLHRIDRTGTLVKRGYSMSDTAPLELFDDGRPLHLARWPNVDEPMATLAQGVNDTTFAFSNPRLGRWNLEQEIWTHGLWKYDWADTHLRVKEINSAKGRVTLESAPPFGFDKDQRFYFYNLLEELDQPGEYVIDRASQMLYVWPLGDALKTELRVSMIEAPLLRIQGSHDLVFSDLTFEDSRTQLVEITEGARIRFEGCRFRNNGTKAVYIAGSENGLDHCEITGSGEEGVILAGGSRATLTPGKNYLTHSRVHRTGRIAWGFHPGVFLDNGCGNLVSHNLIDSMPHSGMLFDGNNHLVDMNEVRWVCESTNDAGAIYAGQDWGYRGIVLRNNFIHHIQTSSVVPDAHGIYLDDLVSGPEVAGNILYQIEGTALFCGGGRDLNLHDNVIGMSGRGHYNGDYSRERVNSKSGSEWNLLERLAAVGIEYQKEPWLSAYPECAAIPNSFSRIKEGLWRNPEGTVYERNAGWGVKEWMVEEDHSKTGIFSVYKRLKDNPSDLQPLFDEDASLNRSFRMPVITCKDLPWFRPLPFADIGPLPYGDDKAERLPPAPELKEVTRGDAGVTFVWVDRSNVPANTEAGFELLGREPQGKAWRSVSLIGPDTDHLVLPQKALGELEMFRVRAYNRQGESFSGEVNVR